MSDLTAEFNSLLKEREAPPTRQSFSLEKAGEFIKEAYRISTLIRRLHQQLLSLRQAYLSTAIPRKLHLRTSQHCASLNDRDREAIDSNAHRNLRDLHARIGALLAAEELRRNTENAILNKKHNHGGSWAVWAAGGLDARSSKTAEHAADEAATAQVAAHREGVLCYLRQRLQVVADLQKGMVNRRLERVMERNRLELAKARGTRGIGVPFPGGASTEPRSASVGGMNQAQLALHEEERKMDSGTNASDDLSPEQRQRFEKGNQDMLKYYEGTLEKVKNAEQSLLDISEIQTMLVSNLAQQSVHIDQLVRDSETITEDMAKGNKELQKATQKASPARITFYAAAGLCAFLITWDMFL